MDMEKLSSEAFRKRIQLKAKAEGMKATSKTIDTGCDGRLRLWWLNDIDNNWLRTPERGLYDDQAMEFLTDQSDDSVEPEEYSVEAAMMNIIKGCSTDKTDSDKSQSTYTETSSNDSGIDQEAKLKLIEFLREDKKLNEDHYWLEGAAFARMRIEDHLISFEMFLRVAELYKNAVEGGTGDYYKPLKLCLDKVDIGLASAFVNYFMQDEADGCIVDADAYARGFMEEVSGVWDEIKEQVLSSNPQAAMDVQHG